MGRVVTPKYRLECKTEGGAMTPIAWQGRATSTRVAAYCERMAASFLPGGVNEHVGLRLVGARLVRQVDSVEVATWKA